MVQTIERNNFDDIVDKSPAGFDAKSNADYVWRKMLSNRARLVIL
jgi:hypothetical protein